MDDQRCLHIKRLVISLVWTGGGQGERLLEMFHESRQVWVAAGGRYGNAGTIINLLVDYYGAQSKIEQGTRLRIRHKAIFGLSLTKLI
jgi:hypothetical protein